MEQLNWVILGKPTTIGELKKLIEKYDDSVSFGFRNQALQELVDINNGDYVVFNETDEGKQLRLYDAEERYWEKEYNDIMDRLKNIKQKRRDQFERMKQGFHPSIKEMQSVTNELLDTLYAVIEYNNSCYSL